MVLCVNTALGMGKGKIGAQCAHAAVGVLQRYGRRHADAFAAWEMSGPPKIAVKVKDEGEMVRVCGDDGFLMMMSDDDDAVVVVRLERRAAGGCRFSPLHNTRNPHTTPPNTNPAALAEKAAALGLPSYIVHDAGRTQIAAGSQTVLAIGPGAVSQVNLVTGGLSLL